jgi:hypothetical protein
MGGSQSVTMVPAQVDHPVGGFDHLQIVLDDDHRIAGVGQLVQHLEQFRPRRGRAAP